MTALTIVKTVSEYSPEVAAGLGMLMPELNPRLDSDPIPRAHMDAQIESPWHDQLIAVQGKQIVGAAAVSLVFGTISNNTKVYLEDFVVSSDESVRGHGVGFLLWNATVDWGRIRGARKIAFTSHPSRTAAHEFYLRQGAVMRDTASFEYIFDEK